MLKYTFIHVYTIYGITYKHENFKLLINTFKNFN